MRIPVSAGFVLLFLSQSAVAADLCRGGPREQWLTEEQVAERVTSLGYSDFVLAIEDGCLEAKLMHDGKRIEIYMEPITGEIVKTKED